MFRLIVTAVAGTDGSMTTFIFTMVPSIRKTSRRSESRSWSVTGDDEAKGSPAMTLGTPMTGRGISSASASASPVVRCRCISGLGGSPTVLER